MSDEVRYNWLTTEVYEKAVAAVEAEWEAWGKHIPFHIEEAD